MHARDTQPFFALMVFALGTVFHAQVASAQLDASDGDVPRTRALIEEAISLGVPLYNGGQPDACVAVYQVALRSLLLFRSATVDSQAVDSALRRAAEQSPEQGAWTLRYALDAVYARSARSATMDDERFRIDFSAADALSWYGVNDNVMGGVSQGGYAETAAGIGEFSGRLSLRNNGGFSSVRARLEQGALAGYDGLEIRLRGDGRTYALLAAPANARGSWQKKFTAPVEWETVRVPFSSMALSVRGWQPKSYPQITGDSIDVIGFVIADKNERPFRLEIDWIEGYVDGELIAQ